MKLIVENLTEEDLKAFFQYETHILSNLKEMKAQGFTPVQKMFETTKGITMMILIEPDTLKVLFNHKPFEPLT